ncbi:MAG: thiamine pyrophosphate-dependent dehydrogenase E1 component subunit alpha [bacterium]|nr:thiamine pyrophosphate-dependent dehydrogenase E1 component subunit alpha [bacterium]
MVTSSLKTYSSDLLQNLYRTMVRIRLVEESFVEPILNGEIKCPVHLYTGEEAIATGICANLTHRDYVFGTHRSHGHYIAKDGGMKEMVAEIYGKVTGCAKGRGGSMHVIDTKVGMLGAAPIVAGTVSLAVGAALASHIRGEKRVAVTFFGDGAVGEGVLHEALNFASVKKLPVIFVCENNLYSTHLPISETRPKNNIYEIGAPYGIHYERADGQDVLKVYEAAKNAVTLCREGNGPVFLECMTYRFRGHVGPDDNIQGARTDIRPAAEVLAWKKKDPITMFGKILKEEKIASEKDLQKIEDAATKEVKQAHVFAQKSPFPNPKDLNKYVFRK